MTSGSGDAPDRALELRRLAGTELLKRRVGAGIRMTAMFAPVGR